ncbi:MAG: acyl carrier protein [Lachnospiraceae bacterium]|nr:acyl carrier protein [Lachnospiraceae bacterium]
MDEREQEIRKLVYEVLEIPEVEDINETEELQKLGLDSLNCIELIVRLETAFHMEVPDDRLGLEYVDTMEHICELVEDCL